MKARFTSGCGACLFHVASSTGDVSGLSTRLIGRKDKHRTDGLVGIGN